MTNIQDSGNDKAPTVNPDVAIIHSNITIAKGLLLLLGTLLLGLFLTGIVSTGFWAIFPAGSRELLLSTSATQAILAFILPSFVTALALGRSPMKVLGLTEPVSWRGIVGIVLVYVVSLAALDQIIYWNQSFKFPVSMSSFEEVVRKMEEMNASVGNEMMKTRSVGGLISGIVIIGILTGFAEEMYFRGGIQRLLTRNRVNGHVAVWVTAIVFSAMHFQFYGFVPRLLMGAWFGYLLLWTRSIWASAIAHALNNSVVVLSTWLTLRGTWSDVDMWGVSEHGIPWMALGSALVTTGVLILGRHILFNPKKSIANGEENHP